MQRHNQDMETATESGLAALTDEQRALLPSDEDVAFYREHGYYISKKLFSDAELDAAVAGADRYYRGEFTEPPVPVPDACRAKPDDGGKLRKNALMRVEHDGVYAVVASKGGAPQHPSWYFNLVANPDVELQDGAVKRDYRARLVSGEERAAWWARANEVWPDYDGYQAKTEREIPVFVLEPVAG